MQNLMLKLEGRGLSSLRTLYSSLPGVINPESFLMKCPLFPVPLKALFGDRQSASIAWKLQLAKDQVWQKSKHGPEQV